MPRSTGLLVGTWYRPPDSPIELFNELEKLVDEIGAKNKELYLLGGFNCNLLPETTAHIWSHLPALTNILDIYGLSQLITEPTRITQVSKSLIDLCITNSPENVSNFGVVLLGISDHSPVFMTRKVNYDRLYEGSSERKYVLRSFLRTPSPI